MHSYCLFLCWRASEITRHHEPVYLCLHRAADVVSVSGARRPFAWKVAAKGVVQVWKSLAWKINKLKLALSSVSCTLGSCTSIISINQCDNLKLSFASLVPEKWSKSQNLYGALPGTCALRDRIWASCTRLTAPPDAPGGRNTTEQAPGQRNAPNMLESGVLPRV